MDDNPTLEKFEHWLFQMDDALERFLGYLPSAIRTCLDFSPNSLDTLESWLIDKYESVQSMKEPSQSEIVDGVARYIGETFRHNLGGKWTIEVDDADFIFFALPILEGCQGQQASLCPLALGTASVDRRKGNYLRTILKNMLNGTKSLSEK